MSDPRPDNVDPKPALADIPIRDAPCHDEPVAGERPDDPPAEDLTLPTE